MPPKKKGNKKGNDDWEAELGETVDPIKQADEAAKEAEAQKDAAEADQDAAGAGGGLMAALARNKKKKQKKGKATADEDDEDETKADTNGVNGDATPEIDLVAKAPEEANLDEEDVFAGPVKKGKAAKGGKQAPKDADSLDGEDDEEGGKVKSKKEKEREKKEREKQRKKEQVRHLSFYPLDYEDGCSPELIGREEEDGSSSDSRSI